MFLVRVNTSSVPCLDDAVRAVTRHRIHFPLTHFHTLLIDLTHTAYGLCQTFRRVIFEYFGSSDVFQAGRYDRKSVETTIFLAANLIRLPYRPLSKEVMRYMESFGTSQEASGSGSTNVSTRQSGDNALQKEA
jgi:hypothetical protein